MTSNFHRHIRRIFTTNLQFDTKTGVMTCKRCHATCKLHDNLVCNIPSTVDLPGTGVVLEFNTGPCLFDGLTYSEAKDILSERS